MEQLLAIPAFKERMRRLTPETRRWFIEGLIDLFEQESYHVIDVIEDCRDEMRGEADRYRDESEQLRAESRLLHEQRENGLSPCSSPQRSISRVSAPSRLLTDRQGTVDSMGSLTTRTKNTRRRRMCISDDDTNRSSLSAPVLPVINQQTDRTGSPGSQSCRSLPAEAEKGQQADAEEDRKKIHEETRAILQTMNIRETQAEKERERQQDRLERIKRQKKYQAEDRTTQALKLLEKALEMDKALAQDKERQGNQLKSKLDEMKKKRTQKQESEFVEIIELKEK